MAREEIPLSPEQVPEEARQYLAALAPHQGHPFVERHFLQVTWLSLIVPGHGQADFHALEFRAGQQAALIWQDGQGNWGAGRWVRLAHADADITCPPSPLSLEYFQGARANPSLLAAIDLLAATSPEAAGASGVDGMVALLRARPDTEDEAITRHLVERGIPEPHAVKLVQFVPIAFTRFLYRSAGIRFAPEYVLLGRDGQPVGRRAIADAQAFREAWAHCERAAAGGAGDDYFTLVAARSGGYRAIQDLVHEGSTLSGIVTGPPAMWE